MREEKPIGMIATQMVNTPRTDIDIGELITALARSLGVRGYQMHNRGDYVGDGSTTFVVSPIGTQNQKPYFVLTHKLTPVGDFYQVDSELGTITEKMLREATRGGGDSSENPHPKNPADLLL